MPDGSQPEPVWEAFVLTHFWPGNDREATRAAAAAHFAGPIALTEEGMVVSLG